MNMLTIVLLVIVSILIYRMLTTNINQAKQSTIVDALSENVSTRVRSSTLMTKIELAEQISEFKDINESIELVDKLLAGGSK